METVWRPCGHALPRTIAPAALHGCPTQDGSPRRAPGEDVFAEERQSGAAERLPFDHFDVVDASFDGA